MSHSAETVVVRVFMKNIPERLRGWQMESKLYW